MSQLRRKKLLMPALLLALLLPLCAYASNSRPDSDDGLRLDESNAASVINELGSPARMRYPLKLGSPARARYPEADQAYARNVWDLTIYEDRLYIGAGNSSNRGPNPNAGPVPILSFDLSTQRFSEEGVVDEEQIDIFRTLDDQLVIPGHDATNRNTLNNWFGSLHVRTAGSWEKRMNVPNGIHVYDLYDFEGHTYAALGTTGREPSLLVADGLEGDWQPAAPTNGFRKFGLFDFEETLYVSSWISYDPGDQSEWLQEQLADEPAAVFLGVLKEVLARGDSDFFSSIYQLDGEQFEARRDLYGRVFFPDTPVASEFLVSRLIRPVPFNGKLVYIGGAAWNDHQTQPFGLYVAHSLAEGRVDIVRVEPPIAEKRPWPWSCIPWDLVTEGDELFALWSCKANLKGDYQIFVKKTNDLKSWSTVVTFKYPTFARSFAKNGRDFYFGMGTGIGPDPADPKTWELRDESGDLLKIEKVSE